MESSNSVISIPEESALIANSVMMLREVVRKSVTMLKERNSLLSLLYSLLSVVKLFAESFSEAGSKHNTYSGKLESFRIFYSKQQTQFFNLIFTYRSLKNLNTAK